MDKITKMYIIILYISSFIGVIVSFIGYQGISRNLCIIGIIILVLYETGCEIYYRKRFTYDEQKLQLALSTRNYGILKNICEKTFDIESIVEDIVKYDNDIEELIIIKDNLDKEVCKKKKLVKKFRIISVILVLLIYVVFSLNYGKKICMYYKFIPLVELCIYYGLVDDYYFGRMNKKLEKINRVIKKYS